MMSKNVPDKDTIKQFTDQCFDRESEKGASIIKGILEARSPRISDISNEMEGNPDANYKTIQRFIEKVEPKESLHRLYNEDTPFVIGDPTDIERPDAYKTDYVGKLKSSKLGFLLLCLSTPYRGRAIPFSFVSYSSRTINSSLSSRNMEHIKCIGEIKELIGDKTLVLDREFSYESLFLEFLASDIDYVVRLNTGTKPGIYDEDGNRISLTVGIDEKVYHNGVYYKGKVKVNLAGKWKRGFHEPIWVITRLDPSEGLDIYFSRMKIEEMFRDLKNLLDLDKIMNKKQANMEKMVALVLLAYAIGFLIGEKLRDVIYKGSRKWKLYSGLFVLLKRKICISKQHLAQCIHSALNTFSRIILGNVRSPV
jgi:hypothetical protein